MHTLKNRLNKKQYQYEITQIVLEEQANSKGKCLALSIIIMAVLWVEPENFQFIYLNCLEESQKNCQEERTMNTYQRRQSILPFSHFAPLECSYIVELCMSHQTRWINMDMRSYFHKNMREVFIVESRYHEDFRADTHTRTHTITNKVLAIYVCQIVWLLLSFLCKSWSVLSFKLYFHKEWYHIVKYSYQVYKD